MRQRLISSTVRGVAKHTAGGHQLVVRRAKKTTKGVEWTETNGLARSQLEGSQSESKRTMRNTGVG